MTSRVPVAVAPCQACGEQAFHSTTCPIANQRLSRPTPTPEMRDGFNLTSGWGWAFAVIIERDHGGSVTVTDEEMLDMSYSNKQVVAEKDLEGVIKIRVIGRTGG